LKKEKNHGVYPVETINSQGHENDSMWLSHFLLYWDKGNRSGGLPRSLVSSSVGDVCEKNNRKLGEREKASMKEQHHNLVGVEQLNATKKKSSEC
jgi:hypothetical protein